MTPRQWGRASLALGFVLIIGLVVASCTQLFPTKPRELRPSLSVERGLVVPQGVSTDKPDYNPGETVTITGTDFTPNTSYAIPVKRPDGTFVKGDAVIRVGTS